MPASATRFDRGACAVCSSCTATATQQWPARTRPLKLGVDHRVGDGRSAARLGVARLVDMEVEIEAHARRPSRQRTPRSTRVGMDSEPTPPRTPPAALDGPGDRARARPDRGRRPARRSRRRLQLDRGRPICSRICAEDLPGDLVLRRRGVEMGADRGCAVRIGAAKGEIHAAARRLRPTSCASRSSITAH